jgi:hypothetical protein
VARAARNLATHDYETDYQLVADHFNALQAQFAMLNQTAFRFVRYAQDVLKISPQSSDFSVEFTQIAGESSAVSK